MKPLTFKLLACTLAATACHPGWAAVDDTPPPLGVSPTPAAVDTPSPAASAPAAASGKTARKPKAPRDPNATPKPSKPKKRNLIQFPLPINEEAHQVNLPENSLTGELLMRLMALKMKRISNELVQMEESNLEFKQSDGKEDFHVVLPKSVFNLQTHIVSSEDPVTVSTQDFELTGDKMEFDTVERTGKLIGHVHMVVHNLKQVAGPQSPPPAP